MLVHTLYIILQSKYKYLEVNSKRQATKHWKESKYFQFGPTTTRVPQHQQHLEINIDKKSNKHKGPMDFISFASWIRMLSLFENKNPMTIKHFGDTHLDTCHRIWQQDKANYNYNIKIPLYYWLLIYVHMSKPTSGLRPCDINCSKFFPRPLLVSQPESGLCRTSLFTH